MFNFEKKNLERKKNIENKTPFEIKEMKKAEKFIRDLYKTGERPIVTVPKEYINFLKQGLKPYTTWIGVALIAATFGRDVYESPGEERVVVHVDTISLNQIKPRFTGPNNAFSGVVVLEPPIPPESISYKTEI